MQTSRTLVNCVPTVFAELNVDVEDHSPIHPHNWVVRNCGSAPNHHTYLLNVAHMVVVENSGGGDCFLMLLDMAC